MSRQRARSVAKRAARAKKKRRGQLQRAIDLESVLGIMGLGGFRKRFDDEGFRRLLRLAGSSPSVIPGRLFSSDPDMNRKAEALRNIIGEVSVAIGQGSLSYPDFCSYCLPLYRLSSLETPPRWGAQAKESHADFCRTVKAFFERHESTMMESLRYSVMEFLVSHSRVDGPSYKVKLDVSRRGMKLVHEFILDRTEPEWSLFEIEGIRRRAYRCAAPSFSDTVEVTSTTWDAGRLGIDQDTRFPVFIQRHAIEQVIKRLQVATEFHGLLHFCVWVALDDPRLIPREDGCFLAEFRVNENLRVGYLLAERVADRILVKTFLLPTMSGTPEAQRLYDRFRLRRPDLEYLGLTDIRVLSQTDLLEDDTITAIFEECGCGDLLSLVKHGFHGDKQAGYAADFRRYLGRKLDPILDRSRSMYSHSSPADRT